MKKLITTTSILTLLFLSSCTKNYVCSCKKTTNTNGIIGTFPSEDNVITDKSKSEASDICNADDKQFTEGGVTTTINCDLK